MNKLFKKFYAFTVVLIMLFSFNAAPVFAHRINIFAWLENDTVLVECNFGANRPARNSAITVLDSTDNKALVHGVTNDKGVFTFKVPAVIRQGHGLIIEVNAGQGHKNIWRMNAAEFYEASSLTAGFDAAAIASQKEEAGSNENISVPTQKPGQAANQSATDSADAANAPEPLNSNPAPMTAVETGETQDYASPVHVQKIVDDAFEAHMAPIKRQLAALSSKGPGLAEIIGGIGWLIGLIGIALYFKSRRKQD